jgi:hypothetical protein
MTESQWKRMRGAWEKLADYYDMRHSDAAANLAEHAIVKAMGCLAQELHEFVNQSKVFCFERVNTP